jgi:UDP-2,3-diacylglucosamine hydrolase
VPHNTTFVVADLHLGYAPPNVAQRFHTFLESVPQRADQLLVLGDLFEFWFEYHTVVPEAAFPTLERLASLVRAGVDLVVTGGNHDRFGGRFWRDRVGARFHPDGADLTVAGFPAHAAHGDGIGDERLGARLLHAVIRKRLTHRIFGLVHPDLGIGLVRRFSGQLAAKRDDDALRERVAARQQAYAADYLARRAEIDLLILAHTHRAALVECGERRWYVNPGSWLDGYCYAQVTPEGPHLARYE